MVYYDTHTHYAKGLKRLYEPCSLAITQMHGKNSIYDVYNKEPRK